MQREKQTLSGPLMEVDFYPIFKDGRRIPMRAPKTKPSTEEQKKYNREVAIKKFIRLANKNFDSSDYLMHPTYMPELAPQTEEEARRDIVNYLRRVKTKRKSEMKRLTKELKAAEDAMAKVPDNTFLISSIENLKSKIKKLEKPFKYIYVIEKQVYKTGIYAGHTNWHFHLFLTGGIDNKTLEEMWINGLRANCNNYQPEKFGPEAAARYMSKDPQGTKRFSYSRNLEKPIEKVKDGAVSKNTVVKMAVERVDDAAYWERRYKGYKFVRCFPRPNKYNGYWYVSVIMYRSDQPLIPEWKISEWIID